METHHPPEALMIPNTLETPLTLHSDEHHKPLEGLETLEAWVD
jgi:hypothetical protein